jgi:hypothetical protein
MRKHKLRDEAKDRPCQGRIPGVCNGNTQTTVLAHPNNKSLFRVGMGQKPPDEFGAHLCSDCHDLVDGRTKSDVYSADEILIMFYEAKFRTMLILKDEGRL